MAPRSPTLLVIEDARDQALLVGVAARQAHPGLEVRVATDGREGIAYLSGLPPFHDREANPVPNLIVLDLYMPVLDGFEVLRWIQRQPTPLTIPVVVLSAAMAAEDLDRARNLGAIACYRKPGDPEALGRMTQDIVWNWIGRGPIIGAYLAAAG